MRALPPLRASLLVALVSVVVAVPLRSADGGFVPNHRLIVDEAGDRIVELDEQGGVVAEYGVGAGLVTPADVTFDGDGALLVASRDSDSVFHVHADGVTNGEFGTADGLTRPTAIALGFGGRRFVASEDQDRIFVFDHDDTFESMFGAGSGLSSPRGIAIGPRGSIYVSSFDTDRVLRFSPDGTLTGEFGAASDLDGPEKLTFGFDGTLFVTSSNNHRILSFDASGEVGVTFADPSLVAPVSVAIGPDGRIHVGLAGGGWLALSSQGEVISSSSSNLAGRLASVAFAPFRFGVDLTGSLVRDGVAETSIDEVAQLSIFAGTGLSMLWLEESGPLAAGIDDSRIVFHGYAGFKSVGASSRLEQGVEVTDDRLNQGGTLQLLCKGKKKSGSFAIKSASGSLQRSGEEYLATLKVKAKSKSLLP